VPDHTDQTKTEQVNTDQTTSEQVNTDQTTSEQINTDQTTSDRSSRTPSATRFRATVLGYPRIGPHRELKRALEQFWAGVISAGDLTAVGHALRRADRAQLHAAGLDSIPVNTFSYYDHVLDTAVMLGAIPARFAGTPDGLDRYFAMARGSSDTAPLEMTKWFDTNYHYLVPEIAADTTFALHPEKVLEDLAEAVADGIPARPVILGPVSFLLLAKPAGADGPNSHGGVRLVDRLDEILPLYADLLSLLAAGGAQWVQLDEPALVADRTPAEIDAARRAYADLSSREHRPAILAACYFGGLGDAAPALAGTDIDGLAVDLVAGTVDALAGAPGLSDKLVVAGVVDGRNIWRTDPDRALGTLATVLGLAGAVAVGTSCSLLHVPYSIAPETRIDPQVASWLAFAGEKVAEVTMLSAALNGDADAVSDSLTAARAAVRDRRAARSVHDAVVGDRLASLRDNDFRRGPATARAAAQAVRVPLPPLPTTTIGSFPQTSSIRRARAGLRNGSVDQAAYDEMMRAEIADVIALQEELGLDVLVHGEPERNDMVQYFAERLRGFAFTDHGWVQSYGSRCVRPPILFGDVSRPGPITVPWSSYAQSLTDKPVKGMLTGPVTILAWSFVRDDQPLGVTARQVALALRDETLDLQAAGIRIIQVDEPALRELLPLRERDRMAYLDWAVSSFRLATAGLADSTAVHTHLCYSEFGEVIGAIDELDADVTSLEAARSHMEVLDDLNAVGYSRGVGPGVWDIHSPRVPSTVEITDALTRALAAVPADRLWVNPDCGLKTRGPVETRAALANLVQAARAVRTG
jgi:5-methyltetrahydropteroyltriglutamate--homocysteine methyltransferase